ncbi:MAG: AAA family ATPase [Candidatus Methylarchaceae archaeon HK02M2]|nr:AAA family ATPase [Candidatus Methylarchaceae archaeon HK02M2]
MIFKDRDKLSPRYIPEFLPHREEQIKLLKDFLWDSLRNPSKSYSKVLQLIGDVGSGKTVTTVRFGEMFQNEGRKRKINLKHVYLNPKVHGASRIILYRYLVQEATPEVFSANLNAEELLIELMKHLQSTKKYLLISFDEADYFVKHSKESAIYALTRLDEVLPGKPTNVLGVILTARSTKFHEKLDRAELSTLGTFLIRFNSYNSREIFDILETRVKEAFLPKVVTTDVLEYIADVTSKPPVNGDVRYALDLLLYSGILASNYGAEVVSLEHARRVMSMIHYSITDEDIINLSDKGKIVLLAIARALRSAKNPYVSLRDIRSMCSLICEDHKLKAIDEIEEYVQDLADRDIVDIKSLTSIGISRVPMEDLEKFLEGLMERIRIDVNDK